MPAKGELGRELLLPAFLAALTSVASVDVGPGLGSSREEDWTWVHILHCPVLFLLSKWRGLTAALAALARSSPPLLREERLQGPLHCQPVEEGPTQALERKGAEEPRESPAGSRLSPVSLPR